MDRAIPLAIASAFAHCIATGWGRWGDLVTDTGRELELPRRMLAGDRLYQDLRWYYGPLAPHLNAFLYRSFGARIEVLAIAGIASAALLSLALWLVTRRFASRRAAAVIVLTFIYSCAFCSGTGIGIFNFALPYTFAATYGMLAATWSLFFLVRYVQEKRDADFLLSAALLGVSALSKAEVIAPLLAAHGVFAWSRCQSGNPARRMFVVGYAATAAAVASIYGALFAASGMGLWTENLAGVANQASSFFIRSVMGLDRPLGNAARMAGVTAAAAAWLAAGAWLARRVSREATSPLARGVALGGLGGGSAALALWRPFEFPFLAATPAALGAVALLGYGWIRRPGARDRTLPRLLMWVFAAGCLLRIFLRPTPTSYGFYLLVPSLAAAGVALFVDLPQWLGVGGAGARLLAVQAAGMLLGTAWPAAIGSAQAHALYRHELRTSGGRWRTQYAGIPETVGFASRLPPHARVLVVPEGAAINFFARRRSPGAMFSYLPMELARPEDEARIIAAWERDPPDVIALVSLEKGELGAGWFGIDYGRDLGGWIQSGYRPLSTPGPGITLAAPAARKRRRGERRRGRAPARNQNGLTGIPSDRTRSRTGPGP